MIAICVEVYPDLLMAKVESFEIGTRILPYLPESGIRVGTTVVIQVASNIPRITSKLFFGFTPEKIVIMDVDFSKNDSDKGAIYKCDASPDWDKTLGEKVGHQPSIIKHIPGEKVYHVDFQGLKIGFDKVTLFYHPQARIELFKNTIEIIAVSASIISKAGVKSFFYNEKTKESGYSVEKTTVKEDEDFFDSVFEYRGNVAKGLSADGISIDGYIPEKGSSVVDKAIYLMLIIDVEPEEYEHEPANIDHEYKNRKLKVIGGGTSEKQVHSKLKNKVSLGSGYMKSRAPIATIDNDKFPVVYIKAITRKGDVYEFNAGDRLDTSSGDTSKVNLGKRDEIFSFGDAFHYAQKNVTFQHYPVNESSVLKNEFFGTTINNHKGDFVEKHFRREISNKIVTITEYDVDKKSDLDTLQRIKSPMVSEEFQTRSTDFKKTDQAVKTPIGDSVRMTDDGVTTTIHSDVSNSPLQVVFTKGGVRSTLAMSDSHISMEAKLGVQVKAKQILLDSDSTSATGMFSMLDGLYIKGNFYLNADNIIMDAKEYFVVNATNSYFQIEESIGMIFGETFYAQSFGAYTGDTKDHVTPGLFINDTSVNAQADDVTLYGGNSLTAVAKETATYGAKHASIFGLDNQGA